ncbi:MAG: RNA polymerase factor sigma-54 [Treponema sp.]|jgi:RNA polymerase sigma-54 factor|nr:RNA polymerase factor sigma-54 [Treponema sp.]
MQIQRQSFVQELRLKMNPQLYQSIKLMELPIVDLRERIEEELENNPALEILEDRSTVPLDETKTNRRETYEYFETTSDPGRRGEQASEEHRRFLEGVLTRPETLQEHLLWQLQLEPIDDELRVIAETLIQNLDDDGFHKEKPETLFPAPQPRLTEAMELVRGLEPAGTCTADYRESLKVQIALLPDAPPGIEKALDNLELLEREKYSALAKKTGSSEEDTRLLCEYIKKLSPFPGRSFAPADVRYVVPDIRVVRDGDEFIINLNDEAFPVLGINPFFEKLEDSLSDKPEDGQTQARDFAREKAREARLFINHLKQRNKTLIRVAAAVLEFQRAFFINGPKHLAPLTLGDIARELKVHETTVSRTANGKYMQTEWGIFEIRYFFTNSISGTGSSGSRYSKESVKEIIKEIVTAENRLLSDQEISALLSQKGIALARRTVAKYRKELDMGSSYTRKVRETNSGGSK